MFLAAGIKTMILQELQLRPKILQQQRIMSPIMLNGYRIAMLFLILTAEQVQIM